MICTVCKKTDQETALYSGILATEMVNICEECAEDQKVPIIKKPSHSQLSKADKTYSVRERLDRMSGRRDTTEISGDQMVTQRNLARLRMPKPKQSHPEVLDNYYWTLNMARRRAKMTLSQLAKKMDTTSYEIEKIERGVIPENFKTLFLKLEMFLGVKLLKKHEPEINFVRKSPDQEKEILDTVARKMNNPEDETEVLSGHDSSPRDDPVGSGEPKEKEKIDLSKTKLSRREDLSDVTLSDLVDRKRAREKYKMKMKQDEMLGDDLDIEEL